MAKFLVISEYQDPPSRPSFIGSYSADLSTAVLSYYMLVKDRKRPRRPRLRLALFYLFFLLGTLTNK